jgi:hypothetical protein
MKKPLLSEELNRMKNLAGIISESNSSQDTYTEEVLNENLWNRFVDKAKGAAIDLKVKIGGGVENRAALLKRAFKDAGWTVGKWYYGYLDIKKETPVRLKIKSIDYNNGAAEIAVEKKQDGKWVADEKESSNSTTNFSNLTEKLFKSSGIKILLKEIKGTLLKCQTLKKEWKT